VSRSIESPAGNLRGTLPSRPEGILMSHENRVGATTPTSFRSADGLRLASSFNSPQTSPQASIVLVHGGGVTREEGGFFTRMAVGLAESGVASLRFDLRGHGESEGRQEDLTLSGVLNDIHAAVGHVRELAKGGPVSVLGASFGGGISAYFASLYPREVEKTRPDQSAHQLQGTLHRRQAVLVERPDQRVGRPGAQRQRLPAALAHLQAGPTAAQRGLLFAT
jgi:pimeloyl-ACP methyl ester carboxylesterase